MSVYSVHITKFVRGWSLYIEEIEGKSMTGNFIKVTEPKTDFKLLSVCAH